MKVKNLIDYLNELPKDADIEFVCKDGMFEKIDIQWDENELETPYIYLDNLKHIE